MFILQKWVDIPDVVCDVNPTPTLIRDVENALAQHGICVDAGPPSTTLA